MDGRHQDLEEVESLLVNRELQDITKSQLITLEASRSQISVAWENVNYFVHAKKEKLHILKGLSGVW